MTSTKILDGLSGAAKQLVISRDMEIELLRAALHHLSVIQHVRMGLGGVEMPNGGSCKLCKAEWLNDKPEIHKRGCLLEQ